MDIMNSRNFPYQDIFWLLSLCLFFFCIRLIHLANDCRNCFSRIHLYQLLSAMLLIFQWIQMCLCVYVLQQRQILLNFVFLLLFIPRKQLCFFQLEQNMNSYNAQWNEINMIFFFFERLKIAQTKWKNIFENLMEDKLDLPNKTDEKKNTQTIHVIHIYMYSQNLAKLYPKLMNKL